jgi:Holliday junction DNA helicase RuvB
MEDFRMDIVIGEGPAARSITIDLPRFTLVGATTRTGLLTKPLLDRFGIPLQLQFYTVAELTLILERQAPRLDLELTPEGAAEIAGRSRGTPRVAGRLLRRVRDFCAVDGAGRVDRATAAAALERLDVDARGLDAMDRRYLDCLGRRFEGGPVGVETLAAALADQRDVVEEVIEPFLMQQGMILRTPRGRVMGAEGWRHIGMTPPGGDRQFDLLVDGDG